MVILTNWTLQVFRFYEDGTESGSTAAAAQNTNVTRTDGSSSADIHLRVAIWDGLGSGGSASDDWQLQYSRNGGAYTNVTTSSSYIKGFNSSSLTDAGATTQRLTGATGSFGAGEISEDGLVDDLLVSSSTNTELLYSLTLVYADCNNGDTLDFRVLQNGVTITYSVTPRITVSKSTAYTYSASGSLALNGLSLNRTTGLFLPAGRLVSSGVANPTSAFSFQASGGISKQTSPSNPTVGLSYTTAGGGLAKVVSPSAPVVTLNYNSAGGSLGSVTTPETQAQQGFDFFASGTLFGVVADEGGDGTQGEGGGGEEGGGEQGNGNGLRYEEERFIRCCDVPPKIPCCQCEDGISSLWEIQESLEGMYSVELSPGIKQAWGCENFAHDGVRRVEHYLGPTYVGEPERTGECHWGSVEPQDGRCCQFGCEETGGIGNDTSVAAYMSCYVVSEVPPTDPIYQWYLDCACGDLWCGDSSEWGSLEDCQEFDTNCHCCNDEGSYSNTEEECLALKSYYEGLGLTCGSCTYEEVTPGTPGYPAYVSHRAGLGGPCGCGRTYVLLNPLDPMCKDMLDSVDSSNIEPFDCDGCNTYVLVQYIGMMVDGVTECPNYPCALGCVHICNGADLGCTDCCEGWGYYYCLGYPATLTLCPAESIVPPSSDSDCNPDVLCCGDNPLEMAMAPVIAPARAIPDDAIHFEILGTSTTGYLQRDGATYKGGVPPIVLEVNKEARTLNGKPLSMLSDDLFWGRGRIGGEQVGFWIEVSE